MSLISWVLDIFIFLAAVGLLLSLIVHLVGFFNNSERLNKISAIFWFGWIVIVIPAAIIADRITANYPRKEYWERIFMNCPEWMKYGAYFFFAYGLFYIAVVILKAYFSYKIAGSETDRSNEQVFNINFLSLSGMTMVWYSYALAVFYSALQVYR